MPKVRKHVVISGKVQNVGYRQSAFYKAVSLGLTGWVRNLYDGSVEAMFEGEELLVNQMIEWCKEGPMLARVSNVEVQPQKSSEEFEDFKIKSTFGW